jgi:hypothetical protein
MTEKRSKSRQLPVTFGGFAPLSVLAQGFASILLVAGVGCSDSVPPTAPRQPSPTPTPAADLSGSWTGTASQSGSKDDYFCPPQDYPVTLQIIQLRGAVTFRLPLDHRCSKGGEAAFDGVLSGETLSGSLQRSADGTACALDGGLHGTADSSHVALTGHLNGICNALLVNLDLRR